MKRERADARDALWATPTRASAPHGPHRAG